MPPARVHSHGVPTGVSTRTVTPTHGYAEMREAAMTAFANSWRRE